MRSRRDSYEDRAIARNAHLSIPQSALRNPQSGRRLAIMTVQAVLALDQGTTGSTALVIGSDGRVLGRGYREVTQHYPRPGEVEHDPEEILRVTVDAAREALAQ